MSIILRLLVASPARNALQDRHLLGVHRRTPSSFLLMSSLALDFLALLTAHGRSVMFYCDRFGVALANEGDGKRPILGGAQSKIQRSR